ncbi:hypothetical protein RHMOL_Rhmol06G0132100 [Rhododendron molle]|uniref:Uncharacterized protein n=1 Tax=Rhododendron molle TaxID=49168 RepID=A0ACC0NBP4_RHOML|nr:hypothetical protein RHMOL_Rhmol06G0132100 [Rhododendron molle]
MGPAAGELYFDFGISLNNSHCFQQRPNNSHYFFRRRPGSIALPVPVIAAAIRLLPVTSYPLLSSSLLFLPSKAARQLGFQPFPVSPRMPVTSPSLPQTFFGSSLTPSQEVRCLLPL